MLRMPTAYNKDELGRRGVGNLRRLSYFVAVVETGSFTAAAERLGITKAVVSQQVARLEHEFRTSLLTRTTRKVQPTEAGRSFYQRCALILHEAENAFDELAEASTEPSGSCSRWATDPLRRSATATSGSGRGRLSFVPRGFATRSRSVPATCA